MLVYQDNPMGVKLISDLSAFFFFSEISIDAGHAEWKRSVPCDIESDLKIFFLLFASHPQTRDHIRMFCLTWEPNKMIKRRQK